MSDNITLNNSFNTSASDLYTSSTISSSGFSGFAQSYIDEDYYSHDLNYNEIFDQLNDPSLPIISSDTWEKIIIMLDSPDIELIKTGFKLLEGYRFPRGVINITIINKAINKYLKDLKNNKKF